MPLIKLTLLSAAVGLLAGVCSFGAVAAARIYEGSAIATADVYATAVIAGAGWALGTFLYRQKG